MRVGKQQCARRVFTLSPCPSSQKWANNPSHKVTPFEASKWSEWADLLTFDHIMDNYDRSRDYALWKNVHWEPIKGGGARVVYIDQNSCLAQRRFSPEDKNKFYGLCRCEAA